MHRLLIMVLAAMLALSSGCRDRADTQAAPQAQQAAASGEGAMCDEHGVLESVCTKCNPALIPVFKAKGDWCDEHGFPESICPLCHPERGGHPMADLASDGDGPADGTKVRFRTKETARLAGLHFVSAVERPTSRALSVTARVVYDGARLAQVNPRMPGVVRAIRADVGASVSRGAVLAVIESAAVAADQSRFQSASSRLDVAQADFIRVEALHGEGISSARELLAARGLRDEARADLRSARGALAMAGAASSGSPSYALTSPIAGVVTQRGVTLGRLVDADDIAFEIVDPSAMWIDLDVPEADLALVSVGQSVALTVDALPGREFTANVSYVAPAVDTRTRTVIARAAVANSDGALRANLFGRGRITVVDPHAAVLLPRAAVQRARSVNLVFVRTAEDAFEARRVTVANASGDFVAVIGRVKPGDEVVSEGSFLLKTETLKESIGAGCCDVE